jgi:hypothetical protein
MLIPDIGGSVDTIRFDCVTRAVSTLLSRRAIARTLGLGALALPDLADAKKKRRKKKKKAKFNDFGCVNVGSFCKNSEQCCSGICEGNTGKKRCQAHDTSGCQLADDTCLDEGAVLCPDDAGGANKALFLCFQTTGKAGFCGTKVGSQCVACTKDADCVADFGAGAACVVCAKFCADSNHTTCIRSGLPT